MIAAPRLGVPQHAEIFGGGREELPIAQTPHRCQRVWPRLPLSAGSVAAPARPAETQSTGGAGFPVIERVTDSGIDLGRFGQVKFTALPDRIHFSICGKGISGILPVSFALSSFMRQAALDEARDATAPTAITTMAVMKSVTSRRLASVIRDPSGETLA